MRESATQSRQSESLGHFGCLNLRWSIVPKNKLIVLYCWDTWCSLATSAALILIEHGLRVKELYGGIAAWETLRMPEQAMPRA
jgi:rhodanese-related sulfurtransferase